MDHPAARAWPDGNQDLTLQFKVHLGLWTDWSRGRILGATLTLNRQQANLLIAFTASFVVFIGSRFWRIICLLLHQVYSTSESRDALYHQRQALLRNSGSSDSGVLKFIALFHAWRGSNLQAFVRTGPALLLAIICTVAFTVAGGFSSQIQFGNNDVGSSVLLDGSHCGVLSNITTFQDQVAVEKVAARLFDTANNYVQQCYSANSTGLTDCNYFISQRLPGFMDNKAPCPFKDSLCRSKSSNLALDTGFLDTDAHFGLNAPANERILLRHKLHCAPLVTEGHFWVHGNSTRYDYGPQWAVLGTASDFYTGQLNYTYEVENLDRQYVIMDDHQMVEQTYLTRVLFAGTANRTAGAEPSSTFVPDSELGRADADVFIVFLSGHGVVFSEPLYDDWYRATTPFATAANLDDQTLQTYRTNEAASPLGCASQWQFCNGITSACGLLASYYDAISSAGDVFGATGNESTANKSPAADRLDWLTISTYIDTFSEASLLQFLQDNALLSKQNLFGGEQSPIPDDQWKLDATNWFSIFLATMQSSLLQTASGLMVLDETADVLKPETEAARKLCSTQKIRTTRYSSFSFFGLLFTYILGGLVLATSYAVEPILACLHRRRKYRQYAYLEWMTNETLQLHRLAHEHADEPTTAWAHCTSSVPTTTPGALLSSFDISDVKHPKLHSNKQRTSSLRLNSPVNDLSSSAADVSGDSSTEPCFSSPEQSSHEIIAVDTESPQDGMFGVPIADLSPNNAQQVAQTCASSHEVELPSPLGDTPTQHMPRNSFENGCINGIEEGRYGSVPSPQSWVAIAERNRNSTDDDNVQVAPGGHN